MNIDHRRAAAFAPGDLTAYIRATWDDTPDISIYIEAVHRLSDLGAVVTHVAHGTSQEGFDAEWRMIALLTVEGDLINRCELFDEADLDAALARFDELSRPAPRLENAASQVDERFWAHFAARDWDAMAEMLADDISIDDRRRVVNAGIRHGRDAEIANMRAIADLGVTNITSTVIATRGERLALTRVRLSGRDREPEAFRIEVLGVVEIDADERIAATVTFDLDDIDAAFEELDARYLAGEAAAHAHTWSVIAEAYAALNRHELPPTTPDWVNIDHRRVISVRARRPDRIHPCHVGPRAGHRQPHRGRASAERPRSGRHPSGAWDLARGLRRRVAGRRPSDGRRRPDQPLRGLRRGRHRRRAREIRRTQPADATAGKRGKPGFANVSRRASRPATGTPIAEILADDCFIDDRRRVVNAGFSNGRDAVIAILRALADVVMANITSDGHRDPRGAPRPRSYPYSRTATRSTGQFVLEMLGLVEIDADDRIAGHVVFDPDDIDAAFAELDARYLAGEAAAHARTWSVIVTGIRRAQPARARSDDAGLGRPSTTDDCWRARPTI